MRLGDFDVHRHPSEDAVPTDSAVIFKQMVPQNDIPAHSGAEEMVVILRRLWPRIDIKPGV
jgi:hypothetical protein